MSFSSKKGYVNWAITARGRVKCCYFNRRQFTGNKRQNLFCIFSLYVVHLMYIVNHICTGSASVQDLHSLKRSWDILKHILVLLLFFFPLGCDDLSFSRSLSMHFLKESLYPVICDVKFIAKKNFFVANIVIYGGLGDEGVQCWFAKALHFRTQFPNKTVWRFIWVLSYFVKTIL